MTDYIGIIGAVGSCIALILGAVAQYRTSIHKREIAILQAEIAACKKTDPIQDQTIAALHKEVEVAEQTIEQLRQPIAEIVTEAAAVVTIVTPRKSRKVTRHEPKSDT